MVRQPFWKHPDSLRFEDLAANLPEELPDNTPVLDEDGFLLGTPERALREYGTPLMAMSVQGKEHKPSDDELIAIWNACVAGWDAAVAKTPEEQASANRHLGRCIRRLTRSVGQLNLQPGARDLGQRLKDEHRSFLPDLHTDTPLRGPYLRIRHRRQLGEPWDLHGRDLTTLSFAFQPDDARFKLAFMHTKPQGSVPTNVLLESADLRRYVPDTAVPMALYYLGIGLARDLRKALVRNQIPDHLAEGLSVAVGQWPQFLAERERSLANPGDALITYVTRWLPRENLLYPEGLAIAPAGLALFGQLLERGFGIDQAASRYRRAVEPAVLDELEDLLVKLYGPPRKVHRPFVFIDADVNQEIPYLLRYQLEFAIETWALARAERGGGETPPTAFRFEQWLTPPDWGTLKDVPEKTGQKVQAVIAVIETLPKRTFDRNYRDLARRMAWHLGNLPDCPLLRGKPEGWAAGIVHAVGTINELFQQGGEFPVRAKDIPAMFGVSAGTMNNKSALIRKVLDAGSLNPRFLRKSYLDLLRAALARHGLFEG